MTIVSGGDVQPGVCSEGGKIQKWGFSNFYGVQFFSLQNPIISTFMGPTSLGGPQIPPRVKIWALLVKKWPFYGHFPCFYTLRPAANFIFIPVRPALSFGVQVEDMYGYHVYQNCK